MHFLIFFFVFYGLGSPAIANLLIPGIMTETVQLAPNYPEYLGFLQSALNGTEVEIRIQCQEEIDVEFEVQFVIRSSPCAKEFILDKGRYDQVSHLLEFYFNEEHMVPQGYHYDKILFFKSKPQKFSCLNRNGVDLFMEQFPVQPMEVHNVTEYQSTNGSRQAGSQSIRMNTNLKRKKRSSYPGLNGDSIDGGAKRSLTSWHPVQKLPIDSIYILILKISLLKQPPNGQQPPKIQAEVQWRGPYGFLSAIDYPLLRFYGFMCFFYMILAMSWLFVCLRHWRDLLRIQFWIGAVILIGMIEKAVFYAEYANMNESGQSIEGLLEVAELTSCLKRTMAHVLIIIVSVGFGVVKPRLGATLNQVVAVGIVYFIFCALEGLTRVSKQSTEAMKEKQIAKLPLALLEVIIAWWIFSSLISTMRTLKMRRNQIKLSLYRHFTNVLGMALMVSVLYMVWSLYIHIAQYCMTDWKELWVDTAFWHVFFCSILVVIMFLWRPSQNNQRYAFTPLLDDSEDENEEMDDEIFNNSKASVYNMIKQRGPSGDTRADNLQQSNRDDKLEEDLKWIDNNIPISLAEALMDEDDDKEEKELEMSKML